MKNCNDIIGNRTRDLPACSAVPLRDRGWRRDFRPGVWREMQLAVCRAFVRNSIMLITFVNIVASTAIVCVLHSNRATYPHTDCKPITSTMKEATVCPKRP
jgi:hypothetical protein